MAKPQTTHKIAPWSYSKAKSFETCPKQFYHEKILREYPFIETEAIRYGNLFHTAAEKFIRDGTPIPEKFSFAIPVLESLRDRYGEKHCELKMGLTEDLEPCGFFDKNVWFRGVVDLLIVADDRAWVIDYKTGKSARYADVGQLELMAMATFKHFPTVKKINAGLLFVVSDEFIREKYFSFDADSLWDKWLTRYQTMQAAADNDVWNPIPSGLCRNHCQVVVCPHNGRN
jgi:hypothetical protein|tara:strand:+ start:304 stop:990 length:687 start_codon:yes stop_codon:yes gene_type:complete